MNPGPRPWVTFTLCVGFLLVTAIILFSPYETAPHSRSRTDAEISALAENAHIVVGNVPLVLPFVAMPDHVSMGAFFSLNRPAAQKAWKEERDAFRASALSPTSAPILDRITVQVETYGWNDSDPRPWIKLCAQLTAKWAQSVCDNPWSPVQQALPRNRFYLADTRRLEVFSDTLMVGGETYADKLRSISLKSGEVFVNCDRKEEGERQFCIAAVAISKDLIGVWSVWQSETEAADQQAQREGRAIAAFANYALGDIENFDALLAVVCSARRPGSGPSDIHSIPPDPCIK